MGRGQDAATDDNLVAAVGDKSREALGEIYRRYGGAVWSIAKRVCHSDESAEKVCQAVFAELWSNPGRFDRSRGALRSCLVAAAHSRAVDLQGCDTQDAEPDPPLPSASTLSPEGQRAVEGLPAAERDAILLAYFGGRAYIDETRRCAPGDMVKSHIRRGLLNLRRALDAEGVTT